MKYKEIPSQTRLREIFAYDDDRGCLVRLRKNGRSISNLAPVGSMRPDGRLIAYVDGSMYLVHRLIFVYVNGIQPTAQIDHIDQNPSNNKISNLRECISSQNHANTKAKSGNITGFKGVSKATGCARWAAQIKAFGVKHYLGIFPTASEAAQAYDAAAQRLFGDFASLNFPR